MSHFLRRFSASLRAWPNRPSVIPETKASNAWRIKIEAHTYRRKHACPLQFCKRRVPVDLHASDKNQVPELLFRFATDEFSEFFGANRRSQGINGDFVNLYIVASNVDMHETQVRALSTGVKTFFTFFFFFPAVGLLFKGKVTSSSSSSSTHISSSSSSDSDSLASESSTSLTSC